MTSPNFPSDSGELAKLIFPSGELPPGVDWPGGAAVDALGDAIDFSFRVLRDGVGDPEGRFLRQMCEGLAILVRALIANMAAEDFSVKVGWAFRQIDRVREAAGMFIRRHSEVPSATWLEERFFAEVTRVTSSGWPIDVLAHFYETYYHL